MTESSTKNLKILKQKRLAYLMSVREVAEKFGVSHQTWLNYERGKNPPPEILWEKIKRFFKLEGDIVDYWGRKRCPAGNIKYLPNAICAITGCKERPISKGYCLRHYQRERMRLIRAKIKIRKESNG